MSELLSSSLFFGVAISLLTYWVGMLIKKRFRSPLFNPLLIAVILTITVLMGFDVKYVVYNEGAKYLSYLLTPSTVCLAIPLYQQLEMLKKNWKAVVFGVTAGTLASLTSICLLAVVFNLTYEQYVTLLPKSVTTAIAVGISESLGGLAVITSATVVITGIFGNMVAEFVLKLAHIEEPIAKGLACGTSAHAIGTARAMELGELEGAMSSLSIALAGVMTAIAASLFAGLY